MTTIAIDSYGYIAADGRCTIGATVVSDSRAKLLGNHSVIYAVNGLSSHSAPFIEWHGAGAHPDTYPLPRDGEKTSCFIVCDRSSGRITYFGYGNPYGEEIEAPFAVGSGGDFALGAMAAGKTAHEAVKIASRFDLYTGGTILEMRIREPLREAAE